MKTLDEIALTTDTDKGSNRHNYTPIYDVLFSPIRNLPIRFLEIGVNRGDSIRVWLEYFPNAIVYGVDNQRLHSVEDARFKFFLGDQRTYKFWNEFLAQTKTDWDVILDDGCHTGDGIVPSFEALFPHVKNGGLYIIEDLMCSYYPTCRVSGWKTGVEFVKSLIDDLHSQTSYVNTQESRVFPKGTRIGRGIHSIQCYEELAVISRK